jgi:hypothetical protein
LVDQAHAAVDQFVGFDVGVRWESDCGRCGESGVAPAEADRGDWAEVEVADAADEHVGAGRAARR